MEQLFIEDMQDACAIQVPEVSADDLRETPLPERKRKEEPRRGKYDKEKFYAEDPTEEETRITIEELPSLVSSSRDTKNIAAFKAVLNELLSRENCSPTRYAVTRSRHGDATLPTVPDFSADVHLAAKAALTLNLYRVFCMMTAEAFERWSSVPAGIRRTIEERVGAELLRRRIFNGRNTYEYFHVGMKQHGRPTGQRALLRAA